MYSFFIYSNDDNDASKSQYENLIGFNILEHVWITEGSIYEEQNPCKSHGGDKQSSRPAPWFPGGNQ